MAQRPMSPAVTKFMPLWRITTMNAMMSRPGSEMAIRARDDLVCGFIRKHTNLQCSSDVAFVINLHYFAERKTPLLAASLHGYYRVVRALLETPETNVLERHPDSKGMT